MNPSKTFCQKKDASRFSLYHTHWNNILIHVIPLVTSKVHAAAQWKDSFLVELRPVELSAFCPPVPLLTIFLSLYCAYYNTWLRRRGKKRRQGGENNCLAREARRSGVKIRQECSLFNSLRRIGKQTVIESKEMEDCALTDHWPNRVSNKVQPFQDPGRGFVLRLKNDAGFGKSSHSPTFFLPLSWRPYGSCPELGIVTPFSPFFFPRGIFPWGSQREEERGGEVWPYVGTEKIVGRGRQKSVTGWGVKIRPQGGGQFEWTGRG